MKFRLLATALVILILLVLYYLFRPGVDDTTTPADESGMTINQ